MENLTLPKNTNVLEFIISNPSIFYGGCMQLSYGVAHNIIDTAEKTYSKMLTVSKDTSEHLKRITTYDICVPTENTFESIDIRLVAHRDESGEMPYTYYVLEHVRIKDTRTPTFSSIVFEKTNDKERV